MKSKQTITVLLKRYGIWVALLLTLIAAWFAPEKSPSSSSSSSAAIAKKNIKQTRSSQKINTSKPLSQNSTTPKIALLKKREYPASLAERLMADVAPPIIEPKKIKIPEKPKAPAIPFRFIGRYNQTDKNQTDESSEQTLLFIEKNDQAEIVRVGDVIDNTYRIEKLSDQQLQLRYLPLNEVQTLILGS